MQPTRLQLWQQGAQQLRAVQLHYGHGTDNADDEAAWALCHVLQLPWDALEADANATVAPAQVADFSQLVNQRISTRQPLAYLIGEAWFAGLRFVSDARALVPRSSIAELIVDEFQPWLAQPPQRILDVCTGSACIAIACAHYFPQAHVDASDLSVDALALAQENVTLHGLQSRVQLHQSDLFDSLPPQRYELIVSNPPYVGDAEMQGLPDEYRHEPALGLRANDNGLALVQRILESAADFLAPTGLLVVEVGNSDVAVSQRWPELPLTWLEFEAGEGGVFCIDAPALQAWRAPGSQAKCREA